MILNYEVLLRELCTLYLFLFIDFLDDMIACVSSFQFCKYENNCDRFIAMGSLLMLLSERKNHRGNGVANWKLCFLRLIEVEGVLLPKLFEGFVVVMFKVLILYNTKSIYYKSRIKIG